MYWNFDKHCGYAIPYGAAECSLMSELLAFIRSVVVELLKTSAVSFFRLRGKRIINTKPGLHHFV